MKSALFSIFTALTLAAHSQLTDTIEAQKFWEENIQNIVSLNKREILEQTHFPIPVEGKQLSEKQFELVLENYFNQELRTELSQLTYTTIDAWKSYDDATQTYMIVCNKGVGEYNAVVLCFFQYSGKWMLNRMDYQKD